MTREEESSYSFRNRRIIEAAQAMRSSAEVVCTPSAISRSDIPPSYEPASVSSGHPAIPSPSVMPSHMSVSNRSRISTRSVSPLLQRESDMHLDMRMDMRMDIPTVMLDSERRDILGPDSD